MGSRADSECKITFDDQLVREQHQNRRSKDQQSVSGLLTAQTGNLDGILSLCLEQLQVAVGFYELFEDLPVALVLSKTNMDTSLRCNRLARELVGITAGTEQVPPWLYKELSLFISSDAYERVCEQTIEDDDRQLILQLTNRRLVTRQGVFFVAVLEDITRQRNVEQALRLSEERYHTLVENQSDIIVKINLNGHIQFASPSFSRLVGVSEENLAGQNLFFLLSGEQHAGLLDRLLERSWSPDACYDELVSQAGLDGHWFGWSFKAVLEQGIPRGFICIGRDITAQKQAEQNIQQLAYYDHLTSLPNRVLLQQRLQHALSQARRSNTKAAIMFLDLDRFKAVNDSLGHQVGDELLIQVARRLLENIREIDTVARQGGDEFVIVLNGVEQSRQAAKVADKLLTALSLPFRIGGQSIYSGASIGIAMYPDDSGDATVLLKYADMAMYLAKESGRGKFKFFCQDLNERIRDRAQMEVALHRAIERDELFLQYQPQFNIKS